jgi:hypothetical protein
LADPENKETLDKIVKTCYNIYLDENIEDILETSEEEKE